jgi:hypothetical protein
VGPRLFRRFGLFARSGVIVSAVAHVAAVLLAALLTGANPYDSVATEAIMVDIISPGEVPPDKPDDAAPPPAKEPAPQPQFDFSMPQPTFEPTPTKTAPAAQSAPNQTQPAMQQRKGETERNTQQARATTQSNANNAQLAAPPPGGQQTPTGGQQMPPGGPQMPPAAAAAAQAGDHGAQKETNVASMFGMPLTLPDGRLGGAFDAPATETAKLERGSVDGLRARIKSCAMLPADISPSERVSVVLRIQLKPDGSLSGQPTLIEASASAKGPALLQTLRGALQKCQPYNMLPADKYQEWKSLDIRFTPNDLTPG